MASISRDTDINPLSQLYDELKIILSGLVVKFSVEAEKEETLEVRKYVDTYIAAVNKTDSFGLYEYTDAEYNAVGVYDEYIISQYREGVISTPSVIREKLLLNRRSAVIAEFDEPNSYYRELNGIPPKGVVGGRIVTKIINNSLLVVNDDDNELLTDYMSKRLSETSAYNIMGNDLFIAGSRIYISHAVIQEEKTSYSRSFLIVPDEYPIDKTMKAVYLRDVKSIMYNLPDVENIPGDEVIGKYFHVSVGDTLDTSSYFRNSYLVVEDDIVNYNTESMIKISEAVLNNPNVTINDYLLLEGFYYVTKEIADLYGISNKVPIHCIRDYYGERFVSILESSGYLAELVAKHPDKKYLDFIGSKKVDILTARAAKNFDILYIPSCNRDVIQYIFSVSYSAARDYIVNTVYNYYYRTVYDYYDNFIGLIIVQLAIQQTMAKSMQTAIDRDFYDETMVRLLFEMYGVPYYPSLPYQTQRRLVKNLNYLIQNKSTNRIIYDIASILGYHDISVYKYYLVKERNFDSDDSLIYKDTTTVEPTIGVDGTLVDREVVINDLEKMYDVYFQKVDIEETNFRVALTDESKRVNYDEITLDDPLWWDDSNTFDEVYGDYTKYTAESEQDTTIRHYNYSETKYLGLSISYKMSEVLYENILLLRTLMDKNEEISNIFVTLPKITSTMNISLFEVVVFLCALISKQYHLKGEILTRYSSVMDVMGYMTEDHDGYKPCDTLAFNFELLTNAETYKQIINNPSRYLKPNEVEQFNKYLSVLTINQTTVSEKITAINEMYQNIKGLGYFIGRKMSEADNLFEYRAWRDFYNALFIGKENASMFKLGNSDNVATTYLEYLSVMNPALYNAIMEADETIVYTYIDHTISRLEKIVNNLKSLYTVNDSNSSLLMYLIKLIRFFKSYTTDLIDVTTEYIFDMRPDNLFKLVEYYKIHQVILPKDSYHLMYSDTMKIIEKTKEIDPIKYEDFIVKMSQEISLGDIAPINHINCNSCKNFGNCRQYCHVPKDMCTGYYMEGPNEIQCDFYGYDHSDFLDYINHYRDLLMSVDYKQYEDIKASVRTHLKKAYYAYSLVSSYNPYSGEEIPFSTYRLINLLYESLDRINELLESHNFDITISEAGVEGIEKWVNLLTVTGSDVPRKCNNVNYPCRNKECTVSTKKEDMLFKETLYHSDGLLYTMMIDFKSTFWVEDYALFSRDEINKLIESRDLLEDSHIPTTDKTIVKHTVIMDDKTMRLMDTLASLNESDELKETFSFTDRVIMYEES